MEFINKTFSTRNSSKKSIYFPNLRRSLNYQFNYRRPQKLIPHSNIPLSKNYSLFKKDKSNITFTNSLRTVSHSDFHNKNNNLVINNYKTKSNYNLKIGNNKRKKYINKTIEKDLEMMKLQMSCDLISHKINQIKDKVQNLHQASINEDKELIDENRRRKTNLKKNNHNYINLKYNNLNYNLNNYNNNDIKTFAFNDFYKLKNQKFIKFNNDLSGKINNTFDKKNLNNIDSNNFFETIQTTIKETNNNNINDINDANFINKKMSYKNNLKYLLLNSENNKIKFKITII